MKTILRERVQERIAAEGDALALAMRILTCTYVGVRNDVDLRALLSLQCEDGGWEIGWVYKYGVSGIRIGNRGLTTALAIKAIEGVQQAPLSPHLASPSTPLKSKFPAISDICRLAIIAWNTLRHFMYSHLVQMAIIIGLEGHSKLGEL